MATATQNKTDRLLNEVLREVREVRFLIEPIYRSVSTQKNKLTKPSKLPKWLQASLKDSEEGRISGPFDTVDELMAHLQRK